MELIAQVLQWRSNVSLLILAGPLLLVGEFASSSSDHNFSQPLSFTPIAGLNENAHH